MSTPQPVVLADRFARALEFAVVVHSAQVRKGTTIPYVSHLLGVASLVIEHGADEDTAIAAVLHDAPEDQGGLMMLAQIRARFGERVADIVDGCTDTFEDPKPEWLKRKTDYIGHVSVDATIESCLVSAADKLHNARAILHDLHATSDHVGFWSRFSTKPRQLGWYYGSLERALGRRLAGHDARQIVDEMKRALDGIAAIPGGGEFGEGLGVGREGANCPNIGPAT
jgi:hypothetical protein